MGQSLLISLLAACELAFLAYATQPISAGRFELEAHCLQGPLALLARL